MDLQGMFEKIMPKPPKTADDDRRRGPADPPGPGVGGLARPGEDPRRGREAWPRRSGSSSSTRSTRSPAARTDGGGRGPDVSRARGSSATSCRSSKGRRSTPSMARPKTDHVLFVAAGAFHRSKPSDLMPELQGRFPIRVELQDLTRDDFARILREPRASLHGHQYQALLATEGLDRRVQRLTRSRRWPTSPIRSTGPPRTSAPVGCTRSWNGWSRSLSFDAPDRPDKNVKIDASLCPRAARKALAKPMRI